MVRLVFVWMVAIFLAWQYPTINSSFTFYLTFANSWASNKHYALHCWRTCPSFLHGAYTKLFHQAWLMVWACTCIRWFDSAQPEGCVFAHTICYYLLLLLNISVRWNVPACRAVRASPPAVPKYMLVGTSALLYGVSVEHSIIGDAVPTPTPHMATPIEIQT
jgi:hypothetical protein